jgi:biotin carboxylase
LGEVHVEGVKSTKDFVARVLQSPDFVRGTYDTLFVERTVL